MAQITLEHMSIHIPVYDVSTQRLFRKHSLKATSAGVGASDINVTDTKFAQVTALKDVSLTLQDGDSLALIGHNGAGKSTLLRLLAGIYQHSSGICAIDGSRYLIGGASTIGRDATGYENIIIAMELAGTPEDRRAEVIADIEAFTELGEYLHMPTRIYSQGMQARLSFAWASIYNPDILLIDEVIGVGDASFANKVEQRIGEYTKRAKIMVIASHDEELLTRLCNKGAVFNSGTLDYVGTTREALAYYHDGIDKK